MCLINCRLAEGAEDVLPSRLVGESHHQKRSQNTSHIQRSRAGSELCHGRRGGVKLTKSKSTEIFTHSHSVVMPSRQSSAAAPTTRKLHSLRLVDSPIEDGYSYGTGPIVHFDTPQPPRREPGFSEPMLSRSTPYRTGLTPSAFSLLDENPHTFDRKLKHAGKRIMVVGGHV